MFRKKRYENGKRELYIGNFRIFKYTKKDDYYKYRLKNMINASLLNQNNLKFKFEALLSRACVASKYHKIFFDYFLRSADNEQIIIIDGGAHAGVFSDLAIFIGAKTYAFEPNKYLFKMLEKQYKNTTNISLYENALGIKNDTLNFYDGDDSFVSEGGSVCELGGDKAGYSVEMIDFIGFCKDLIDRFGKINLIKLDIEGAEFELLQAFIAENLHEKCEFVMVETHERCFKNGDKLIADLKRKIAEKNITNIYLDWA